MRLLRRVLVWQATLWAAFGLTLVIAPGWVAESAFDQPPLGEDTWLRISGLMAISLAGLMVLVTHRIEELWWWSWTFVILEISSTVVLVLNALVGVPDGEASWPWWLLAAVNGAFAVLQLTALARIGTERPAE